MASKLLLGLVLEIFQIGVDAKDRGRSIQRWDIHHDAVISVVVADLDLDILSATVRGSNPVLVNIFVDHLRPCIARKGQARLPSRPLVALNGAARRQGRRQVLPKCQFTHQSQNDQT